MTTIDTDDGRGAAAAEQPGKIHGVAAAAAARSSASVTARVRANFSIQHLLAAARLAREVYSVEAANAGAPFGPFYEIVLGSSVGCVVLAAASVEAYANELFADRAEHSSARDQLLLDLLWAEYEQKHVLEKFDLALRLRTGNALDRGSAHAQSIDRLVRLRNALAHFKPEWSDESAEHEKLSRKLEHFAGRSPWFSHDPLFPRAWATSSTASWAISAVLGFSAEFSAAVGVPDRFANVRERLSAPHGGESSPQPG